MQLIGTMAPERWMTDVAAIAIEHEVRPLTMRENAARPYGLRPPGDGA